MRDLYFEDVLPVELDEDQVPDLQDVGIVHVHQVRGVSSSDTVVVNLTAGAAGAGVSHLPEVVLHAAREDTSLVHSTEDSEHSVSPLKRHILVKNNIKKKNIKKKSHVFF